MWFKKGVRGQVSQKEDQQKQFFKWSYFHKRLREPDASAGSLSKCNILLANKAIFSNLVKQHKERGGKTLLSGQIVHFSPVLLPDVTDFMEIVSCRVFGYAAWSLWHKATGKDQTLCSFHFWIFGKVRSQTCYFCHTSARPADQTSERY